MTRTPILPLVLADLEARVAKGTQEYGEPLTSFNGRDALQDLYEELLDASLYAKQAMIEREWRPIETAPRDGTVVDLWHSFNGRLADYFWNEAYSKWDHSDNPLLSPNLVTHWMPLPAAPVVGGES